MACNVCRSRDGHLIGCPESPMKIVSKPVLRVPRYKAELDAANARIAELEAEVAALRPTEGREYD